jgi:hypothetical protein
MDGKVFTDYEKENNKKELFAFSIEDYYNKNDKYGIGEAIIDKLKGK